MTIPFAVAAAGTICLNTDISGSITAAPELIRRIMSGSWCMIVTTGCWRGLAAPLSKLEINYAENHQKRTVRMEKA